MILTNTIVLASLSPRRKEILSWGGWQFEIIPANIDERALPNENAEGHVQRLAEQKALHIAAQLSDDKIIVAADTIVVDNERILGKPKDARHAAKMLKQLRGRTHQVKTAIAVVTNGGKKMVSEIVTTKVPMREYNDKEITTYIASGDPFDKAGSYAIQNKDFKPVAQLSGCFSNVAGLPLCHLTRLLKTLGVHTEEDVAGKCQAEFEYECDITNTIL